MPPASHCQPHPALELAPAEIQARLAHLFDLREHLAGDRAPVEDFIHACFAQAHGASITHFMPRLLSLRAQPDEIIAAFGLREAAQAPLFLESYLAQPIEHVLAARLDGDVRREHIIEVGNLSARYPGAARWLIVALTALLHQAGFRWVVFTGTAALRNGFARLGLRPIELGRANPDALPAHERAHWGRYYDHQPVVMVGDIADGYQTLLRQHALPALLRAGFVSLPGDKRA